MERTSQNKKEPPNEGGGSENNGQVIYDATACPQVITGSGNDQGLENAQVPSTRSIGFNLGFKF